MLATSKESCLRVARGRRILPIVDCIGESRRVRYNFLFVCSIICWCISCEGENEFYLFGYEWNEGRDDTWGKIVIVEEQVYAIIMDVSKHVMVLPRG